MSTVSVYRYMSDAELLKTYKRFMKKADRELRGGYYRSATELYGMAKVAADEMDRRKDQS